VVDAAGAPVTRLTQADFVIREDGVAREVLKVAPATAPIELTLVVDNSAVTNSLIADIRRALTDFVKEMAPGNQIALTTFGGNPEVLQTYTGNAQLLTASVGRLFPISGTGAYLLDALLSVTRGVAKRAPERAVVLAILSQGAPEFSNQNAGQVVSALRASGVRFDAITIQSSAAESPDPPPGSENALAARYRDQVLDEGSRATGGVNERALSGLALAPKLKVIVAAWRSQYLVTYFRPESLIPPERIQVSVKKGDLVAHGTPVRPGR
jgi:VWFA-related protein